jgi:hypothetical protein
MKLVAWQVNEIIQNINKMNCCFKKSISEYIMEVKKAFKKL